MIKRKNLCRFVAAALSLSVSLPLVACSKGKGDSGGKGIDTGSISFAEVWSMPSTVKIKKEGADFKNRRGAELTLDAVRNEYESVQLVLTAKDDIESFTLTASDLKNGEHTFSKDNFTVYCQKFISYTDLYYGSGDVADALVPMDAAAEHAENRIAKDENGAFWVTVYVPEDIPAGKYEGGFTLAVKKKGSKKESTMRVPVSLTVRDYTLSDTVTARTLFSWRYDRVSGGEMDGSVEMMKAYYDFFRDYRISLEGLPMETLSGEEFVNNIREYHDSVTSYCLLSATGNIIVNKNDPNPLREQLLAVAAASSAETNYFDKLMIYHIDEPVFTDPAVRRRVITENGQVDDILKSVADEIGADGTGKYSAFKQLSDWRSVILDIPQIIPMGVPSVDWLLENQETAEGKELLNAMNCICPVFANFEGDRYERIVALCERFNLHLWWYGCVLPKAPGPNYHIGDENLLSSRSVSWLQYKYGIEGNLYWDAAAYTDEAREYLDEFLNVYEQPRRINDSVNTQIPAGDGNLAYPGAKYGIYGPLPSTRLMSIRDGMEEYELLKALDEKLTAEKAAFGSDFSVENAMEAYYRPLAYSGILMNRDGESGLDFTTLRTDLLSMISGFDNGLGLVMGNISVDKDNKATFTYYVSEGSTVTVGGEKQQSVSGNAYSYSLDLTESTAIDVVVTNRNGESVTYNRFVAAPSYVLNDFTDASVLSNIAVTEGSTAELAKNDANATDGCSLHATVNSVFTGDALKDGLFKPSLSVNASAFGGLKIGDMTSVYIPVYITGLRDYDVSVRFYSGESFTDFGSFHLNPGTNTLVLNVSRQKFSKMDSVDRVALIFNNEKWGGVIPASYDVYIDGITADK